MTTKNSAPKDVYDTKINYSNGRFNEELYNEYIKQHLSIKENNLIGEMWNSVESEDRCVNYISIGLKSDRTCSYSELLLLELESKYNESKYIPLIIPHINTSSPYALMRTTTDFDDDDNEDDECSMNLYDLQKIIMKGYDSTKIINYILL
jgi:hypothetical protein